MKYRAKVTTRGQMTIPQAIRETLEIREGDEVYVYVLDDRRAVIETASYKTAAELQGVLKAAEPLPDYEVMRERAKSHLTEQHLSKEVGQDSSPGGSDEVVER